MTDEERKQIVSDVLAALKQNSTTIDQMLEKENCADDDFFETNKGNKISFKTLSKGYNEEQGAVGDAVRYQFKRSDGKKLYPQTSSACVTMSDGDDSLDTRVKNITTEYNVSLFHPKQGIDGGNKYTLETAIALVPSKYRTIGLKCSFVNESGKGESWEYKGTSWTASNFKQVGAGAIDEVSASITEVSNKQGIYNVDANIPLSSGQFYTASTARNAVPSSVRKIGLIITYKTDATTNVTEQFIGSAVSGWTTENNWTNVGSEGGNKILTWNTDAATTRKQVLSKERKEGLMITYKNASGQLVNEQYKSTNYSDTEWVKDGNWLPIVSQYQLSPIEARAGYVVCSTVSSTVAKVITKQNFVLDTKCRLLVKMTYSNTANLVTLNINNTGAIPLFLEGARVGSTNSWDAGDVLDIFYDGENYQATLHNDFSTILIWNTDVATTRKQVPLKKRKEGLLISYKNADGDWVNEQFIGTMFSDKYWASDGYWVKIPTEDNYDMLGYSVIKEYPELRDENGNLIGSTYSEGPGLKYINISEADYVDAVIRTFVLSQTGLTFWNKNKEKIIGYIGEMNGQYIDGNNFRFFLKKPIDAVYISVGAYSASDINYLRLLRNAHGEDIIKLNETLQNQIETSVNTDKNVDDVDLEISDIEGNVLAQFYGGNIRTKNFDSSKVKIDGVSLAGKKLSILSDSITTFKGFLPSDEDGYDGAKYLSFYPFSDIDTVEETWWYQLVQETKMELLRLCAWSGSLCCGNSSSTTSAAAGCSNRRISDLSKDGINPDVIIVFIGINDFGRNKSVGSWNGGKIIDDSSNVGVFSDAYALMVSKIMKTYPEATVFCCTLMDTSYPDMDVDENGVYPPMNSNGETVYQFNEAIRTVAKALGANIIDFHSAGINYFNLSQFTGDKLHPNAAGAKMLKNKAYLEIVKNIK